MTVHSGTIETCLDREGFYVAGGCNAFIPLGILSGNYNVGFMLGYHPLTDHLWGITNSYIDSRVRNQCYYEKTRKEGLLGIYTAFNRKLIDIDYLYLYSPVGWGEVGALVLVGGDLYFNVDTGSNSWRLGMGAYLFIDVHASMKSIVGAYIKGSLEGKGTVGFELTTPLKNSYVRAHLGLDFTAEYGAPLLGSGSKSVSCSMRAGSDGFGFSLNKGSGDFDCGGKREK